MPHGHKYRRRLQSSEKQSLAMRTISFAEGYWIYSMQRKKPSTNPLKDMKSPAKLESSNFANVQEEMSCMSTISGRRFTCEIPNC